MLNKLLFILLLLLVSLWGCSGNKADSARKPVRKAANVKTYSHSSHSKPLYTIKFKKGVSYGSTKKRIVVVGGARHNMAKVDNKGRVFIPDDNKHIDVFAPDGRYLTHLGRKGKGPGEFIFIGYMRMGPKYLYVWESQLERINVYSLDSLSFSHEIKLDHQYWSHIKKLQNMMFAGLIFAGMNGKLLIRFVPINPDLLRKPELRKKYEKRDRYHYYWMSLEGKIIPHEVLQQQAQKWVYDTCNNCKYSGPAGFHLPFSPKPLIAVSHDGIIFAASSKRFSINVYNAQGAYLSTLHYAYKNTPLKRKSLIKRYNIFRYNIPQLDVVKHRKLPKTWPALHLMLIDDQNRLWVSTIVENQKVYQWWVLNKEGKLLARFIWPRDKPIQDIKNNYLYATVRNKEGVARIVKYKIQMQHSENAANP
jgi:hypothetical protein